MLLEEDPTNWTELEVIVCKNKKQFASYHISSLLGFDFNKKPRHSLFHLIYPSGSISNHLISILYYTK